ncbi:MAG TPA: cellobiose phosphorylase, partial [Candidatus Binatia bacterium]|nr:cellobiose phosphorylase [Candidatus Binatia bacterium]
MWGSDQMLAETVSAVDARSEEKTAEGSLEQTARHLAQRQSVTARATVVRPLLELLPQLEEVLEEAYREFVHSTEEELALSYAAEWLLDNYYLVQRAERLIEKDLPETYYEQLPKLADETPLNGYPRVYGIARKLVAREACQVDVDRLRRFVGAYQEVEPLTMGELWVLPLMLRLVLLQSLAGAAGRLAKVALPELLTIPALRMELALSDADVVAASIPSLRRLADEDWKEFFERVSLVEQILSRDPAQLYKRTEFKTRDYYRKTVEKLAVASARPEVDVARAAVSLAAKAGDGQLAAGALKGEWAGLSLPREAHVGHYLLGEGRPQLEAALAYRPAGLERIRRWIFEHPTLIYLGSIGTVLAFILLGVLWYTQMMEDRLWQVALAALVAFIPATTIAVGFVNWVLTQAISPHILPKLDFSEGVPVAACTMVVIPAMLTNRDEVESLLRQLELHYLRNPDPNLGFALLTDFADAEAETLAEDEVLLQAAIAALAALNERHPGSPFYLFHRKRLWNEHEGVWMGWERKRGKLHEFNCLLRGSRDTSYIVEEGDLELLPKVQYVITLDADTVLPRGSGCRLAGALAHPQNRARFDPETGKVVAGYTILQPRTEIQPVSIAQSLFVRVFAGDAGIDLYTLAVSDVYQDLFGEGIYVGKGIYDVDAFERSLRNRVPENALLSHDLFEGIHGRVGLVTDIILYEDYPPHYLVHVRRSHRWVRGDWQLLPWILPLTPRANGTWERTDFDLISWWKIVDNLRRSLVSPALLLLFLAGWTILPGSPLLWTLFGLLSPAVSLATNIFMGLLRRTGGATWNEVYRPARDSAVRWLLFLSFLPYESTLVVDAVVTTLLRLLFTRRHLLQWTTAAHTTKVFGKDVSADLTWRRMISSLLTAMALTLLVQLANPSALAVAAPLLAVWMLAPQTAYWISRPRTRQLAALEAEQLQELHRVARRTWFFFEHFVGPDDNWLPPDHFQEVPKGIVAHRTSPSNIGLYLVATLAAYHFGYLGALGLILRLRPTFETLTKLERYRGHFLNWIDTRSLNPLLPRYVSTVDSGNLAACLLVLSQGCAAVPHRPALRWERWQGLLDTLSMLDEAVAPAQQEPDGAIGALRSHLNEVTEGILGIHDSEERWVAFFLEIDRDARQALDRYLLQVVDSESPEITAETLRNWRFYVDAVHLHLNGMRRELEMLLPWLLPMQQPPSIFSEADDAPELQQRWQALCDNFPLNPLLMEVPELCASGRTIIQQM